MTTAGAYHTERTGDGVRLTISRREAGGHARMASNGLLIAGLLASIFMLFWMWGPMSGAFRHGFKDVGDILGFCFGLLGLPGLAVGLGLVAAGLWLRFGKTAIEVDRDHLSVVDSLGLLRWRRRRPVELVRAVEVHTKLPLAAVHSEHAAADEAASSITGLKVICENAKPLHIFCGIGGPTLRSLGDELADQIDVSAPARLTGDVRVEVSEPELQPMPDAAERDAQLAADQPGDSKVEVDRRIDGLTLTVPAVGVFKNKAGLFTFGLIWCGFIGLVTVVAGYAMFFGPESSSTDNQEAWLAALFALVFWGVGIAMLIAGWNMGRRFTVVDVVGDTLLLTQVAPLGKKEYEWRADQIKRLRFGPSGIESNDEPIMCLRVEPVEGRTRHLFTGRDEHELTWMAALLRGQLNISDRR